VQSGTARFLSRLEVPRLDLNFLSDNEVASGWVDSIELL
jgi:hypothetical protein